MRYMKQYLFPPSVILLLIAFASCNDRYPVAPEISQLYGTWQWLRSVGGIMGEVRTPKSTGHTGKAIFHFDGTVAFYRDDILVEQYRYTITREKLYPNAQEALIIEFLGAPAPSNKQTISYQGVDTLFLSDLCMDCYQHTYARIKQ